MDEEREDRLLALIPLHDHHLLTIIHFLKIHRPMSKEKALERIRKDNPSAHSKIMKLIEEHKCLWSLTLERFDQLVGTTLRQLVKEDICHRPLSYEELKNRKVLKI